jgi:lipoprotein-releasing system permease protein
MLIASVNMIGALSLLVLEKQKDMAILSAMGAGRGTIRIVFLSEGVLWSLIGGVLGLTVGGIICWIQQRFGLVELGGSFLIKSYPIALQAGDFLLVLATVIGVGLLVAWYPATRAASVSPGDGENLYAGLR